MIAFLEKVWPATGNYLVACPASNGSGYIQVAFATKQQAYEQAIKWSDDGVDAYFAVASVTTIGNGAKRDRSSTSHAKAFWIDIDCGEDKSAVGKGYKDQLTAASELREFCKSLGLTKPTIVNSGYGLHCYWILDQEIGADRWLSIASKFKAVLAHYGLLADSSRTADRTSVLRVPGTKNYKRGMVADVKVVSESSEIAIEQFTNPVKTYFEANHLQAHTPTAKVEVDNSEEMKILVNSGVEFVGVEKEFEPAYFDNIVGKCGAIKFAVDNVATLTEPQWRTALSVAYRCVDADYAMAKVSEGHAEYSESAMIAKAAATTGPHTCPVFRGEFEQCKTCTQAVSSPIILGRREKVVEVTGVSASVSIASKVMPYSVDGDDYETPKAMSVEAYTYGYPSGYDVLSNGEVVYTATDTLKSVSPYPIRHIARITDHFTKEDVMVMAVKLPIDGWREFSVPMRDLSDPKCTKFCAELAAASCVLSAQQQKYIGGFMSAYIQQLVSSAAASKHHAQLGWDEERTRFAFPAFTIGKDGTKTEAGISSRVSEITKDIKTLGSFDEWKKVVDIYSRVGYEAYAFGHAVGYGSLLMPFTPYSGGIVNFVGDSGSGKSTILKSINSIFGHPDRMLMRQEDKMLARFQRIGVLNNICATCDELTNISPEEASQLCLSISGGRERHRLQQTGAAKENNSHWRMLMAASSNSSLYERLGMAKTDSNAEAMRVFEYHVRSGLHKMTKREAEDTFGKLDTNYGHAGERFIAWVAQNQERASETVRKWQIRFDDATDALNRERYWSAIAATTLAGAELSAMLGLNSFDVERLFKFAVEQVSSIRNSIGENNAKSHNLIADFMNRYVSSTLTVEGGYTVKDGRRKFVSRKEPTGSLLIRVEIDNNRAYIDKAALRRFIIEGGSDFTVLRKELLASKMLLNDSAAVIMSEGSHSIRSGRVPCWLIDLKHREMNGEVLAAVTEGVDSGKLAVV